MRTLDLRIPPALVTLAAAFVMWLIAWLLPSLRLAVRPIGLAGAIALLGVAVILMGVMEFRRSRTSVNPMNPAAASSLVVTGVFRVTRNPMYLGMAMILLAWAVFLSNPLSVLGVAGFVAYMNCFQIGPEETALRAMFSSEFAAYGSRVRRWL